MIPRVVSGADGFEIVEVTLEPEARGSRRAGLASSSSVCKVTSGPSSVRDTVDAPVPLVVLGPTGELLGGGFDADLEALEDVGPDCPGPMSAALRLELVMSMMERNKRGYSQYCRSASL